MNNEERAKALLEALKEINLPNRLHRLRQAQANPALASVISGILPVAEQQVDSLRQLQTTLHQTLTAAKQQQLAINAAHTESGVRSIEDVIKNQGTQESLQKALDSLAGLVQGLEGVDEG